MEVRCPACSSLFRIADELMTPGVRFRCSVCKHVFAAQPPSRAAEEAADRSSSEAISTASSAVADKKEAMDPVAEDGGAFETSQIASEKALSLTGSGDPHSLSMTKDDVSLDRAASFSTSSLTLLPPARPKSRWWIWLLLCILAVGGGAWWYLNKYHPVPPLFGKAVSSAPQAVQRQQTLYLKNARQYYVQNAKVGQILVVEVQLVNPTSEEQQQVELEYTLYDANMKVLVSKRQFGGVILSPLQLRVLDQEELESHVQSATPRNGTALLAPGESVTFMTLFYAPPAGVSTFGVKIVRTGDTSAS